MARAHCGSVEPAAQWDRELVLCWCKTVRPKIVELSTLAILTLAVGPPPTFGLLHETSRFRLVQCPA
jgi:hypothetical protein